MEVPLGGLAAAQQAAEKAHALAALEEPILGVGADPIHLGVGEGGDFPLQLAGALLGHGHKLVFHRVPHPEAPPAGGKALDAGGAADHAVHLAGRALELPEDKKGVVEQEDLAQIPGLPAVAVVDQAVVHLHHLGPGQQLL